MDMQVGYALNVTWWHANSQETLLTNLFLT